MSNKNILKVWLAIGLAGIFTIGAVPPSSAHQTRPQTPPVHTQRHAAVHNVASEQAASRYERAPLAARAEDLSTGRCWIPAGGMDLFASRAYGYWGSCSTPGAVPAK